MILYVASVIGRARTELAAFDQALIGVGAANFNLVRLSSVTPPGSTAVLSLLRSLRSRPDRTLWRWALARQRDAGHRTLMTRAVEEELHGPVVGLVDLFDGLESARATMASDGDRYQRGRDVLATLRQLAAQSPIVVALDDVQWIDPVSAAALRYAFRRLETEPVLVLATERFDPSKPPMTAPSRPTAARRTLWAGLGRSDPGHRLLRRPHPPAADARAVHVLAGGNPL